MDGENWREPAELAKAHAPAIYRLAYARTGSRADAEDIMQEVFVRLLRAGRTLPTGARPGLAAAGGGQLRQRLVPRSLGGGREGPLTDSLPAPEHEDGGVVEAVLALPAKYRTAVHLYYYEELSVAEIAKITGKSESAVKSRLFRARAMLREALKEDDDVSERL